MQYLFDLRNLQEMLVQVYAAFNLVQKSFGNSVENIWAWAVFYFDAIGHKDTYEIKLFFQLTAWIIFK